MRTPATGNEPAEWLWAKSDPCHPLWCHLLDVAAVARRLTRWFGSTTEMPDETTAFIAGLHDVGKADDWFQNKDTVLAESLRGNGVNLPVPEDALLDAQRRFRHEARSAEWVQQHLTESGWGKSATPVIGKAIHGHHGSFTTDWIYDEDDATRQKWDPLRSELLQRLLDVLQPPECTIERFGDASEVGAKLSGLIVLADWIASNHELYQYERLPRDTAPDEYFRAAEAEAAAALRRLEFDDGRMGEGECAPLPDETPMFRDVWPDLREKSLRPVQQTVEEQCLAGLLLPGLAIVEAPMGEGKTETAVYLAECWNQQTGRRGCYLALPTQATANQMHQRYQRYLSRRRPDFSAPRLVHGMAWLLDDVAGDQIPQTYGDTRQARFTARDWFRPARRALLAAEGVGTVDQALMAALNVKFGFLRLLGLSAKTLVIDEVHAYDDFMTTIMERLLEWCRTLHIPVILLSATLSLDQKQKLCRAYAGKDRKNEVDAALSQWPAEQTHYPLVTSVPLNGRTHAIPVEVVPGRAVHIGLQTHQGLLDNDEETALLAAELITGGGCLCVLANTVKAAQGILECLQSLKQNGALADTDLILFHARFPAGRRNGIEEQVTGRYGKDAGSHRPRKAILVATQVVEQSLDVDFDVMLSQIAPVDLLLQRSGRVWRHDRPASERHGFEGPVLHVLMPDADDLRFGATECVYEREILLRTLSLLTGRQRLQLPEDFRVLVEGCYGTGPLPNDVIPTDDLREAADKREQARARATMLAREHLLPKPSPRSFTPCKASAEEGEGETNSYFVAQTRMGNDSISVLLIDDPALLEIARSSCSRDSRPPDRELLKRLFLQKVGLPRWWLMSSEPHSNASSRCEPVEGYETIFDGENWLRNQLVLPLRQGKWRGRDSRGREFVISNDHVLGVYRQPINSEGDLLDGQSEEEADAGYLG